MKKLSIAKVISILFLGWALLTTSTSSAQTVAAVTITTNSLGTSQIPTDFLGLSMEWQYAQDYFGTTAAPNNVFFQLMKNLGSGIYRIGGNSTDEWCWDSGPSECQHQMTAGMINSIFNASAQTGFGIIAGVNLTDGSTTNTVDTVTAFVNDGINAYPGSRFVAAEIGNEPDLFDTSTNTDDATYTSSYTIGDNEADYKKMVTALNANATTKSIPWTGPAFAGGWSSQLGSWISAIQSDGVGSSLTNPALITIHNYPLSNCGSDAGTGTISGLLSASAMNSHITSYAGYEQTVANAGYKLRIAETNSSACGGSPAVSDVQAAALWGMDDMFRYAQVGIVGVNFHGGGTSTSNGEDYSAVFTTGSNGEGTASQGATVAPLYYSMLMFSNATGKYFLPTTISTSDNITAYAVASSSTADPQVFVINKDTAASGLVTLKPSETMTSATILFQQGTSLSDSSPTYGGVRPSASTGVIPATTTTTLTPNANGVFQFTLPLAGAAMITLHRGVVGTPTPTATPIVASTWRVNAGGPAYTDSQGHVWAADENYDTGTAAVTTNTITGTLPASTDQTLYQSQRYGSPFTYTFNVPAGSYQVTLKFTETYFAAAGSRVFNVSINGTTQLTNFDVYSAAGGQNVAIDKVFNNVAPSGGTITIEFGPASVNNALVQAIQIVPQPATATFTATPTQTATYTPTQIVSTTPTYTPTLTPTFTPTSQATATFTFTSVPSNPHPPYPVICYCLENTKAPTTTVTDNGQGAAINWSTDVPWQDMTVICDAFAIPSTSDTFDMSEAKGSTMITPAHAHGVRCVLSIGGGSQDSAFGTLCTSANRAAFASAVTTQMMKYGYDGVDIDWESNTNQQADATSMMEDIYRDVKALPNSTVDGQPRTLSFTTVNYIASIYNMTTLGNYTDWCFFMGYDWGDCTTKATGPLNAIETEIQSLTDGATWSYPINKMVMGMPFYADYYTNNCNDTTDWDTLSILKLGTAGAYNSAIAEQAYTVNGDTVEVDVAQSFCDKTNYALTNHLMGIGMWDMGNALPYTDATVSGIWSVIGGQAACLNLGPTATPTKTATPVVASTWRVNAGGPAYTDTTGAVWAADENYSGGTAAVTTNTITNAKPAAGDQTLYQSQRYGTSFSYTFNVPAGSYQVTLKFAETYFNAAASREFNVSINGTTELTNFDIWTAAGGQNKGIDEVYNNIAPTGGTITITFGPSAVNNAEVEAIQIIPMPATATFTATPTLTATPTFTATKTLTATASSTSTATSTNSPTMTNTASNTPTYTYTLTSTATSTWTATSTSTATSTNSFTPVNTATSTSTYTYTSTPTWTSTSTNTFTPTVTNTGTLVPSNTPTATATATNTFTFTSTATATATNSFTAQNTATSTYTNTLTPTFTATNTFTATSTNSNTVTATATATVTNSFTSTNTATNTYTPTATVTATATNSFTSTKTATATSTATNTFTFTPTLKVPTATNTFTFTPTKTFTSTPTKTATPASACAGIPAWSGNSVAYAVGQKVSYDGHEYQCLQAHTSESVWEPSVVPALWKDLGVCGSTTIAETVAVPVVFPNPVTGDTASIQLSVSNASNVSLKIYTVAMRAVQTVTYPQVVGNTLSVRMIDKSGINLADGLYYFQITVNGQSTITKVLVLR